MIDKQMVDEQPSKTLARGLWVLEAFNADKPSWGIRELSRELNTNPATLHRLMTTLCNFGYLEQDPETERYSLGPRIVRLAVWYSRHNPLAAVAHKVFKMYADQFQYNFYLGKLQQDMVVYLAVLDGRGPLKIMTDPGATIGLHTTALGKALLAYQDNAYIDTLLASGPLQAKTPISVTDPDKLRRQLVDIRANGYAINHGEHFEELGAVGVPLFLNSGKVEYCISLTYPQHLIQEGRIQLDDLIPLAKQVAQEIQARIGYQFYDGEVRP
jgi:IclR family KDG regulon transcriptional repressor